MEKDSLSFPNMEKRFLDNINNPILLQDREHRILWANKAASKAAGKSVEQLKGQPCHRVLFSRESPCKECPIDRAWHSASVEAIEISSGDGKVQEVKGYPVVNDGGEIIAMMEILRDVTARYTVEEKLREIRSLSRDLVLAKDEERIADLIVDGLQEILEVPAVNVWLVEGNELVCKAFRTVDGSVPPDRFPLDSPKGITVAVVKEGKPIFLPDTSTDERYLGVHRSEICVPIIYGDEVLGVLNLESDEEDTFDEHFFVYLQTLADQAALAIENARVFERLRFSEEFHRAVLETMDDAVIALGPDGRVTFWNTGAENVFGYTKEEALGKHIHEVVDTPEVPDKCERMVADALEKGRSRCSEVKIRRKDGSIAIVSQTVTFLGEDVGFVITASDVTEVERVKKELEKSERRYRNLFENSPVGLFQSTPDGKLISVNETLIRMLGFDDRSEALSHSASEFYVDSSERERWKRILRRSKRLKGFEIELRRKDGSTFWGRLNVVMVADESGQVYYEGSVEDITEKKIAEQALSESEARYRKLVENLPIPLIIHKGDRILYANLAASTLLDVPESKNLNGASVSQFINPTSLPFTERFLEERPSEVSHVDLKMISLNGRSIEAEVTWIPIDFRDEEALLMVINDVTYEVMAIEKLKDSEKRYRSLVENLPAIVYIDSAYDLWNTLYISPRVKDILGFSPEEYLADPDLWLRQLHPEDKRKVFESVSKAYENLQDFSLEYRMLTKDGKVVWIRDDAVLIKDENGKPMFYQGVMFDISNQKSNEERLLYMATHDMLTGLPNRVMCMDRLKMELQLARSKGSTVAVMLLDIDQFKKVNDTLGHDIGDKLLKSVAVRLSRVLEGVGFLSRMAGDEFIALVPDLSSAEEARSVARRMVRAFESPVQFNSHVSKISISLGIAIFPEDDTDATGLLRKADMAMYAVKRDGGNGYRRYEPEMEECIDESLLEGRPETKPGIPTPSRTEKNVAPA